MVKVIIEECESRKKIETKMPVIPKIGEKAYCCFIGLGWDFYSVLNIVYIFNKENKFTHVEIDVVDPEVWHSLKDQIK